MLSVHAPLYISGCPPFPLKPFSSKITIISLLGQSINHLTGPPNWSPYIPACLSPIFSDGNQRDLCKHKSDHHLHDSRHFMTLAPARWPDGPYVERPLLLSPQGISLLFPGYTSHQPQALISGPFLPLGLCTCNSHLTPTHILWLFSHSHPSAQSFPLQTRFPGLATLFE